MDISAIRAKLDSLNNTKQGDRTDFSAYFWKPEIGKHTIRIVPSAHNPEFPFTELKFHYGIGKFPMIALSNFGKQDPIEEFVKELRKTSDKENWSLSGKISPKTRIFAPVIVRGEEDKGVRFWGFGVTIYKALLALAEDEDIVDYTSVTNGWDLVVETVPGNPYPETSVRIKPKQTPLSLDSNQVEKWLREQPTLLECFTAYDYDFINKKLQAYLYPDTEKITEPITPTAGTAVSSGDSGLPPGDIDGKREGAFSLEDKKPASSSLSKFDSLFED